MTTLSDASVILFWAVAWAAFWILFVEPIPKDEDVDLYFDESNDRFFGEYGPKDCHPFCDACATKREGDR